MLSHDDLKWIATTSTELNSILQQVARYSDLARRHPGEPTYMDLLGERVELASKSAQSLFDHVTTQILTKTTATSPGSPKGSPGPFTVLPPPLPSILSRTAGKAAIKVAADVLASAPPTQNTRKGTSGPRGVPDDIEVRNRNGQRELILFVEDEIEVADIAAEIMAEAGYKVIVTHNGFEALKIYERVGDQIGLVMLDFFLPIMDGDAVYDELRALNPNVAVVLSSGFAEQSKISQMLAQGLRGFIPKPYTSEKLLQQMRSILDTGAQGPA